MDFIEACRIGNLKDVRKQLRRDILFGSKLGGINAACKFRHYLIIRLIIKKYRWLHNIVVIHACNNRDRKLFRIVSKIHNWQKRFLKYLENRTCEKTTAKLVISGQFKIRRILKKSITVKHPSLRCMIEMGQLLPEWYRGQIPKKGIRKNVLIKDLRKELSKYVCY